MSYLIDTNVISEGMKRVPDPEVVRWLTDLDEPLAYLSVVTISEIRYGVERLPAGRRRTQLAAWLDDGLIERFADHVVPVDLEIANRVGRILATAEAAGRRVGGADALIAATALCRGFTVVTRNVKDFEPTSVAVIDPWTR